MAAKNALPAYLGGGAPALGYFPDFMPGQQAALSQQLAAGYQQPTGSAKRDGLVQDRLQGSAADYYAYLNNMYASMGTPPPAPGTRVVSGATIAARNQPVVAAPVVVPKKKTAKPTVPWRPTTYDPNRR